MRLIDADKLYPDCMTKNGTLAISQNQIANAPTVEERPKGEWIKDTTYGNTHIFCSCCKMHCAYTTNFCPHCGADMRKGGVE